MLDPASVKKLVLPNGLTVIIQTDHSAPVVAVVTYVKAGYFDERDDEIGISHVLEHMYFKGTPTRGLGEVANETKAAGGYLNAHTIYDNTTYYTVLPASAVRAGLEIQFDAYANSLLDAGELGKEIEVIVEEARRKADSPGAVATETLYELLHDTHRIRRWRIGREAGLRKLTRERLAEFYRNFYRPSNTVLVVSGDVDVDATVELVARLHGSLSSGEVVRHEGPKESAHSGFRYRDLSGDVGQSQFLIGWRTPGATHADTAPLDFAASLLGAGRASRLYRAVRERRLASSISCGNQTPLDLGVFVAHGEAEPAKTADALRATWNEIRALSTGDIDDREMERVRTAFDAGRSRQLETAAGRASYLAQWEALGDWRLGDEYRRAFLETSAADVRRVAAEYLTEDRAAVLVYRPESSPAIARDAGEMRALLGGGTRSAVPPSRPPLRRDAVGFARADVESVESGVHVFRTPSGIPILVRRKEGAAITYIAAQVSGGAVTDPAGRDGLTLLAARTMLKGTRSRSAEDIAEETERIGATLGAGPGSETVGWHMSVPTGRFGDAMTLLADVLRNPAFDGAALETERSVALSSLALLRDNMVRYPMRLATAAAFEGHPYGAPVGGTDESLRAISEDDLREWHARMVLRSPMAIGVVTDLEPDAVADRVAAGLEGLEIREAVEVARPEWPSQRRIVAEPRNKAQTALALAFPGPSRGSDDRVAAALLSTIASGLGGRLFDALRDRESLAYTVSLSMRAMRRCGMFVGYIATSPEKETIARDGFLRELRRLCDTSVTDLELDRAKEYLIGAHAIGQESGDELLSEMLDAWLFGKGLRELKEHDSEIRAVTAAAIQHVARESFDPEVLVEGIVRGVKRTV